MIISYFKSGTWSHAEQRDVWPEPSRRRRDSSPLLTSSCYKPYYLLHMVSVDFSLVSQLVTRIRCAPLTPSSPPLVCHGEVTGCVLWWTCTSWKGPCSCPSTFDRLWQGLALILVLLHIASHVVPYVGAYTFLLSIFPGFRTKVTFQLRRCSRNREQNYFCIKISELHIKMTGGPVNEQQRADNCCCSYYWIGDNKLPTCTLLMGVQSLLYAGNVTIWSYKSGPNGPEACWAETPVNQTSFHKLAPGYSRLLWDEPGLCETIIT